MLENLVEWYKANKREMPWRETKEPYKIWLSEVMLQQTQVITVMDYYKRFIERYPTVESLAKADESEVLKLWEGLGYYSRARNLKKCAEVVTREYKGVFPRDYDALLKLPSIGPYTAGAVSSIAYGIKAPAVDGNVMRVLSRIFRIDADISQAKSRKLFENKVMELMPDDPGTFNQALMELGAMVCTPRAPLCGACPESEICEAKKSGVQMDYPKKLKKMEKQIENVDVLVVLHEEQILIEKRNHQGMLKGLWGLPSLHWDTEIRSEAMILAEFEAMYGLTGDLTEREKVKKHVFTHRIWQMTFNFIFVSQVQIIDDPQVRWISLNELENYAIPTAFRKNLDDQMMRRIAEMMKGGAHDISLT